MIEKRMLGFWETNCKLAHDMLHGTTLMVCCTNLNGTIDKERLFFACKLLFHRHPLLRAIIRDGADGFYFELAAKFSEIPMSLQIATTDQEWQRVVEQELQTPLNQWQYLWRVKLLSFENTHYLIIAMHHGITDGLSLGNFVHELLSFYDRLLEDPDYQPLPLPLHLNIESLLEKTNSWQDYLHHMEETEQWEYEPKSFHQFVPLSERKSRNFYLSLTAEEMSHARNQCRINNVSTNAYMNAMLLYTAAEIDEKILNTTLNTPISLRQYCDPELGIEHLGCNISMVRTLHQSISSTTNVWELASDYRNQLQQRIPQLGFLPKAFDFREVSLTDIMAMCKMQGVKKRQYFLDAFVVSNMQHLNIMSEYVDLKVQDVFMCSNHVAGEIGLLLGCTSMQGRLTLVFMYTEPLLESRWVEKLAKQFKNNLLMEYSIINS